MGPRLLLRLQDSCQGQEAALCVLVVLANSNAGSCQTWLSLRSGAHGASRLRLHSPPKLSSHTSCPPALRLRVSLSDRDLSTYLFEREWCSFLAPLSQCSTGASMLTIQAMTCCTLPRQPVRKTQATGRFLP